MTPSEYCPGVISRRREITPQLEKNWLFLKKNDSNNDLNKTSTLIVFISFQGGGGVVPTGVA